MLIYSYLLYPGLMRWLAGRSGAKELHRSSDYRPHISIITAVYNEESVLEEKLDCLEKLDYPKDKLHVYFGSDKSTDRSNEMLSAYASTRSHVTFIAFDERRGKIGVINSLGKLACETFGEGQDHILLYNDANVMLTKELLLNLVPNFADERVALVDSNMVNIKLKPSGISMAERTYINREVLLKNWEGKVWGLLQGAFGGCYGLRSDFMVEVPQGYLVDDFYISFRAMMKGGYAINDLNAICFESASHDIWQEFKRKSRISAGNFQNLRFILRNWKNIDGRLRFCFVSHKVLRWLGPFLLLIIALLTMLLAGMGLELYLMLGLGMVGVLIFLPITDLVLSLGGVHIGLLRKIRYFLVMNIALLKGFFRYVKGIKNGYWEPPKRV